MIIKIIAFGQIAEITGKEFSLDAKDVTDLKSILTNQFPLLEDRKYAIAINKKIEVGNLKFADNDTVALMSPYSGG